MHLKLNKPYLIITISLLITEVLIATYLKTGFIRHTFGDFLATILVYASFKSFFKINAIKLGVAVLLIAFTIEFAQLINVLKILNLENNYLIKTILGSTFQISDLVAYTLGLITVIILEFNLQ
ncbi:hypothetical protein GCM10022291_28030 [Postechiella marina]|uniref:DUF2809 domain-containing protein n=1 Tax=Postechiella marina TaxID=943941 RepID=A0ABP8CED0_9FLAO